MASIPLSLEGKVALVSGSTGGIGRQVAHELAEHGADVVVNGRNEEAGHELVADLEDMGVQATFARADMTDWEQVERAVSDALAEFDGLDILVTSGGAQAGPMADFFHRSDPDSILGFAKYHYASRLYFIKACLEHLQSSDDARIINLTTDAGRIPTPGEYGPGGQAAAVMLVTRVLAQEFSRWEITVNGVALTVIEDTELLDWLDEESPIASIFETARERQDFEVTPEHISELVAYLAGSKGARPISGQTISVSGGVAY